MRQRRAFDVQALAERSRNGPCFICEFLKGTPGYEHIEVFRTQDAVVFLNKFPTLFGYVLVAPLQHREQVTGAFSENEFLDLQRIIYRAWLLAPAARRGNPKVKSSLKRAVDRSTQPRRCMARRAPMRNPASV